MNILNIIKEEYYKVKYNITETEEDIDYELYDKFSDIKFQILAGFLNDNARGIKHQPWKLIPFPRLKKIWEDFMYSHVVRDVRGLEMIEDIVTDNILKLYVNTELAGHGQYNPDDDFEEYNYSEDDKEKFYDYIGDNLSDYAFEDFGGRRLGLTTLLKHLRNAKTPEQKVPIIDQILNVVHQRSDLAGRFVEGGSSALSQLSGSITNN